MSPSLPLTSFFHQDEPQTTTNLTNLTHPCEQFLIHCKKNAARIFVSFLSFCATVCVLYIFFNITAILNFELVLQTTDALKLQQDFGYINAHNYKSFATANYLLQLPNQYFSARSSITVLYSSWKSAYTSLTQQATQDFMIMESKRSENKDEQYIMVKLLVAFSGDGAIIPNVKTLEDVITLLGIIETTYQPCVLAEDLFWTHPFTNVSDLPSLNLIVQPPLQQFVYRTTTDDAAY